MGSSVWGWVACEMEACQMREKKILVLSPVPTHPPRAGSWMRVHNLLKYMQKLGFEIHFVFCSQQWRFAHVVQAPPDIAAMKDCWDAFHQVYNPRDHLLFTIERFFAAVGSIMRKAFPRSAPFLDKHSKKIQRHTRIADKRVPRADHFYHDGIDRLIMALLRKNHYDHVLCEYVYYTRCFRLFDSSTQKIVDTLDSLSQQHALETESGLAEDTCGLNEEDEHRALSRADVILAIQDSERNYFSKLLGQHAHVLTVGHIVDPHKPLPSRDLGENMLFVGTRWTANMKSLDHFIRQTLPRVRSRIPEARLLIAGNVCKEVLNGEGVVTLGEVEDLAEAYSLADVVVSPMLFGTGLKIKSIEALGWSKPVVMSAHAAVGLEEGAGRAFLVADSPEETADTLVAVLQNRRLRDRLSREAGEFVRRYNEQQMKTVKEILQLRPFDGNSETSVPA